MTAYPIAYPAVWLPKIIRVAELAGIKSSARDKFVREMVEIIKTAHRKADNDPTQLRYVKETRQLIDRLRQDLVVEMLMGAAFTALRNLRERFHEEERFRECPVPKHSDTIIRHQFVFDLLDAADKAGGKLGVNDRNGRGPLVEAVTLLQPHLPDFFRYGLGAETLSKLKTAWGKKPPKITLKDANFTMPPHR